MRNISEKNRSTVFTISIFKIRGKNTHGCMTVTSVKGQADVCDLARQKIN